MPKITRECPCCKGEKNKIDFRIMRVNFKGVDIRSKVCIECEKEENYILKNKTQVVGDVKPSQDWLLRGL